MGGTTIKGAVVDREGHFSAAERRPTGAEQGPKAVIDAILGLARDLAAHESRPSALGLAMPGLVSEREGTVIEASNLGLKGTPIRQIAMERLGIAVEVLHDVRAAALAEGLLGAARGHRDYLLLTLGTGVGAAVVIDGHPYTGAHGIGGELGHMCVHPRGPRCACGGVGCVEAIASAGAVARRYGGRVAAEEVAAHAAARDPEAERVWRDAVDALALAVANYQALLDPELVVIGGGLASAGDALFAPLRERAAEVTRFGDPVSIVPAGLSEDAGARGAAIAAWRAAGLDEPSLAAWAKAA